MCRSARINLAAGIALGRILCFTITAPDDLAFFARVRRQMDVGEASAVTKAHVACVSSGPGRVSTKPAALKSPSNANASRRRSRRMTAKLVASTNE